MESKQEEYLQLLSAAELQARVGRVTARMRELGLDAILAGDNVTLFYLTGRVYCGYIYVEADGSVAYFVRRPSELKGSEVHVIRKPEEIAPVLAATGRHARTVGLMLDDTPWATVERLRAMLGEDVTIGNGSAALRRARSVKTEAEIKLIADSGIRMTKVYNDIPRLYREGMTDIELQIEIERALRLEGCLGQFRVSGPELEIFMGNVLTGENADTPSPYDFAMGGAGLGPSLPVGANGTIIRPGAPVMVDMNGNFTGYMADMTRCYVAGEAPREAVKANELSRQICSAVADMARPGVAARDLYAIAVKMVDDAGMAGSFMGHRYHAGFVGHGIGIQVNEMPVLAPRSRDILEAGNVIAVEPKFVIPGIGAVGIENTYAVQPDGPARCLTGAHEEITNLV